MTAFLRAPAAVILSLGAALLPGRALSAGGEASARDRHAAECVAALEASADDLVRQVKAGQDTARRPLMERLTAGAAFIGDTYLHGDADETRARALIAEAEQAQRRLGPAELTARQAACAAEGARMVAKSNALERAVLRRLAKKRMERLLGG